MNRNDRILVLASASPRRKELLEMAGIPFEISVSKKKEKAYRLPPKKLAEKLAKDKALDVSFRISRRFSKGLVLGADTIVTAGRKVLGKPVDYKQAKQTLLFLSGRMHIVVTGVALVDIESGSVKTFSESTKVWFRKLETDEIEDYLSSGEAMDKAGAYGIQGRAGKFVEKIEGCYFNVVGLPVSRLVEVLKEQ